MISVHDKKEHIVIFVEWSTQGLLKLHGRRVCLLETKLEGLLFA